MCGITGFCRFDRPLPFPESGELVEKMGEVIAHRGPDDSGVWLCGACALAHRRLAVIDPAGGAQPMMRGNCVIVYNGELYNTPTLRSELAAKGHTFSTHTDTEVVLEAYREYGEDVGVHLEGIYAFAIWDGRRECLFCCRDRFGVKPFFYALRDGLFLFGSELKALFAHPAVTPEADDDTWREVLGICPARTPGTGVFHGVYELLPAHYMRISREGITSRPYWRLKSRVHTESYEDTVAHVRELLCSAIRRQLVSDVPLCTLLSGGLDSSFITAVAANAYREEGRPPLETYSFDYTDNRKYFKASTFQPDADWPWVERMREEFSTDHTVLTCEQQTLVDLLGEAMRAKDFPGMADCDSSLLYFCRNIHKRHIVAISGECSDEIFGGYPWFHRRDMLSADTFPWCMDLSARTEILRPELVKRLDLEEAVRQRYHDSVAQTPYLDGETGDDRRRREIGWLNLTWFMTNLLDRKDRISMATGLEIRVPFCDHHLVEYVWNIPWEMKSRGGVRKQILRDAAKGILPEDVRNRPKSPYPKTHNPLFERLARERLLAILDDRSSPLLDIVDEKALRNGLLTSAGDYGRAWFGQLMAGPQMIAYLVQLNEWMTQYGLGIRQ